MILPLLAALALAAEPSTESAEDGRVVGRVVVPAPESDVRAVVEDPLDTAALSPEVVSVDLLSHDESGCELLETRTRGLLRPLEYRSRRCPTETGWRDDLLDSDDFSAYAAEWELHEVDGGTEVTVSVLTELNLPVPRRMVEKRSHKTVGEILRNLVDKATPATLEP